MDHRSTAKRPPRQFASTDAHARHVVIGSRGSALAMWQTNWVIDQLTQAVPGLVATVKEITTQGDRTQRLEIPLAALGDKSMFVAELERALLNGQLDVAVQPMNDLTLSQAEHHIASPVIDAAVHSLKDLPGVIDDRLVLAAVTRREDSRDVLVSRFGYTLATLPAGATVATSSLRRRAQLLMVRPDLRIVDIRGNVDTRVRKSLAEDGPDATVLASAGLHRLGLEAHVSEYLPVEIITPAAGQGALAVEIRADDEASRVLCQTIDHAPTRYAVTAERAVLAALGGGCRVPLGVHAIVDNDCESMDITAVVASVDGKSHVRATRRGTVVSAETLGRLIADELLAGGAAEILRTIREG